VAIEVLPIRRRAAQAQQQDPNDIIREIGERMHGIAQNRDGSSLQPHDDLDDEKQYVTRTLDQQDPPNSTMALFRRQRPSATA
jgi:hypothetical protein